MNGDPEFVILKHQAWLDAAEFEENILGAIMKEFLKPTDNYVPDKPLQYNSHDLVEGSVTDFVLDTSSSAAHEASASLKSIAGISFKGNIKDSVHLTGKLIRYKRLQQHDQFWARLRVDPSVTAIVPEWISWFNTWPACLVVGIMTCEDVELSFEGKQSIEREGHVESPIGAVTLAAGVPNPLGCNADPNVTLAANRQTVTIFKASKVRSSIFALELKKITTERFRRKELQMKSGGPGVDPTRLAGNDPDEDNEDDRPFYFDDLTLDGFSDEEFEDMVE